MSLTARKKASTLSASNSLTKLNSNSNTNTNTNNRKKSLTKPGWDSTNSNLEHLKCSEQEIVKVYLEKNKLIISP